MHRSSLSSWKSGPRGGWGRTKSAPRRCNSGGSLRSTPATLISCTSDFQLLNLEALAVAKMEGYTNKESAERLDCSVRTVERQLRLIRNTWQQEESR